jgi:hypothetical protein
LGKESPGSSIQRTPKGMNIPHKTDMSTMTLFILLFKSFPGLVGLIVIGRSSDFTPSFPWPSHFRSGLRDGNFPKERFTAAGTVGAFHTIPFSFFY